MCYTLIRKTSANIRHKNLIKTYTYESMIVLDSCMGSGSTGVACGNTGRKFIGFEMDEEYFFIAKKRIGESYNSAR